MISKQLKLLASVMAWSSAPPAATLYLGIKLGWEENLIPIVVLAVLLVTIVGVSLWFGSNKETAD